MAVNYVKFQRGSQEAYDALKAAGKLDSNTLYFIYKNEADAVGALYMGNRIISGGDITIASATLDDLADVVVTGAGANAFLVKEGSNWVAKTLEEVVALIKGNFGDIVAPAQVFQGEVQADETADAALTRIVGEAIPADGDNAILKKAIADDKYEYTAYVYTNKAWAAMDGNYNAKNVYFDSDLVLTANVGVQTIPSSGSKTLVTTGKNVKQVLDMLFAARKLPTRTLPAVSLNSADSKAYEVGTSVSPKYSATLSAGSYTYGPATGITASSWSVVLGTQTLTTATGTFDAITVADNTNLTIKATANYEAGAVPVDNLGEAITDATELANCQIQAGSASKTGATIRGYRKAFYGAKTTPIELTSTNIRGLNGQDASGNSISISIPEGAKQVVIAVPTGRVVKAVADTGAFGTDIFSSFVKSTVSVGGADATAEAIGSHAKDYNVYVYSPAAALGANTYNVTLANG